MRKLLLALAASARAQTTPAEPRSPQTVPRAELQAAIDKLGDLDYTSRTAAARTVRRTSAEQAVPALRKALQGKPSLDVRRRLEGLLAKLEGGALSAEQRQVVRALAVLERIDTREARQLLKTIAAGPAEAWLTEQARQTLERLAARSANQP